MAGGSRSRFGCWTCRLRRKKCDERRPGCEICESLGISCHGYGTRPDWFDRGEREKAKSAEVRRNIKNNVRRDGGPIHSHASESAHDLSPSSRVSPMHGGAHVHASQRISDTIRTGIISNHHTLSTSVLDINVNSGRSTYQDATNDFDCTPSTYSAGAEQGQTPIVKDRDASLLMYYLDYVFPLQFKMYDPAPAEGGRGWLLSLLLRTTPLYHMSLALAAHVMQTLETPSRSNNNMTSTSTQLAAALQNLQQYITQFNELPGRGSLEENVKVMTCIMQMVAFVGFAGGTERWQIHMKGASIVVDRFTDILCSNNNPDNNIFHVEREDCNGTLSFEELNAVRFLVSIYTHMEITNCLTLTPILGHNHERLLRGEDPPLRMDKAMGCDNMVMLMISKIGALDTWKRESQAAGKLSMMELVTRGIAIENELQTALKRIPERQEPTKDTSRHGICRAALSIYKDYLTEVYALSALTYLHVVVSGPHPELPEIRKIVKKTMDMFRRLPEPIVARTIYWGVMITGAMALPEEEDLIRSMLTESDVKASFVGPGRNILKILEECWRRRRDKDETPIKEGYWADVMSNLDLQIMLL